MVRDDSHDVNNEEDGLDSNGRFIEDVQHGGTGTHGASRRESLTPSIES